MCFWEYINDSIGRGTTVLGFWLLFSSYVEWKCEIHLILNVTLWLDGKFDVISSFDFTQLNFQSRTSKSFILEEKFYISLKPIRLGHVAGFCFLSYKNTALNIDKYNFF